MNPSKLIASLLFLCLSLSAFSQKVKISGIVTDSLNNPLEVANVIALKKDSKSIESFGITNAQGKFQFQVTPNSEYTLKVSYLGLKTAEIPITVASSPITQDISMKPSSVTLNAVEIVYEMPVKISGDTVTYATDAFVNGTERKLGDVLEKLPGIDVNDDGEIEVEGTTVSKVMVEGKDFFDGDTKLATQNIPADAVDKVEVLKNYNEVSQLSGLGNDQDNIALNIKLKEGKKRFWFGDITAAAGEGEGERYLGGTKLFYYSPEKSINLIGNANNIGTQPFTMRDYFNFTGGFRGINRRGGTSLNLSNNSLGFSLAQNNRANEIDTRFGAANFSFSPSKAWDISGFGIYSGNETNTITNTIRSFHANNEVQLKEENNVNQTDLGLLKFSTSFKPNVDFTLRYDVLAKKSFQNESEEELSTVEDLQDVILTEKEEEPFSLNQNLNLYYTASEKSIFAFEAQHLFENQNPFYNALLTDTPFVSVLPLDNEVTLYDINQSKGIETSKFDGKLDYYYILNKKSNLNFTVATTLSSQNFNSRIFQILENEQPSELNDEHLNNDVEYSFSDIYTGLHYKVVKGKFTVSPGVSAHYYQTKDTQLATTNKDDFVRVLPDLFAMYQFKRSESLRLNYSMTTEFSDISKIAEGVIFNNYQSLYSGNRNLESSLNHNLNLSYFSFNMFNFTNINASANYSKRIDAIKNSSNYSRYQPNCNFHQLILSR